MTAPTWSICLCAVCPECNGAKSELGVFACPRCRGVGMVFKPAESVETVEKVPVWGGVMHKRL